MPDAAHPRLRAPLPRRTLAEETLVVLSLSLLASAVFAILSLLEAPLRGVTVASVSQSTQLARQVFGTLFSLAPVWLVVYLVRRNGEGLEGIGLLWDRPRQDVGRGSFSSWSSGWAASACIWPRSRSA